MTNTCEVSAEKQISRMFAAARLFAILTVISAHIAIRNSAVIAKFYSAVGSIGVIVFFIAAGYYLKQDKPFLFIKKKAKTILLPWMVLGTAVYVVNSILNGSGLSLFSWVQWQFGYKTYLYFVPVVMVCFVLFYYNNLLTLIAAIILNGLSLMLTCSGVLEPVIVALHITNYLNVFNWIGFFALGILLRRIPVEKSFAFFKQTRLFALCLSVFCIVLITFTDYKVGYFSPFGWAFELVCTWSILGVCTFERAHNKFFVSVSEMSYAIYILHMMFVGVLAKVYGLHPALSLFANVIVLLFTWFVLTAGRCIAGRVKLAKVYNLFLGIR